LEENSVLRSFIAAAIVAVALAFSGFGGAEAQEMCKPSLDACKAARMAIGFSDSKAERQCKATQNGCQPGNYYTTEGCLARGAAIKMDPKQAAVECKQYSNGLLANPPLFFTRAWCVERGIAQGYSPSAADSWCSQHQEGRS
jgi:hypothetical protein